MKLFKFKFSKLYILLIIIFSMLSASLNIIYPVIIGNLIDKLGSNTNLIYYFIILALIFICLFFSNLIVNFTLSSYSSKLSKNIRKLLFNKLHSLPLFYLEKFEDGDIVTMFSTDIENVSNGIIQSFSKIINGIFTTILAIFIMINLNISLTIILILLSL